MTPLQADELDELLRQVRDYLRSLPEGEALALEQLQGVRECLAEKESWTQFVLAKDAAGIITNPSKDAVSFCLVGACRRNAQGKGQAFVAQTLLTLVCCIAFRDSLTDFNDAPFRKHEHILSLLDATIAMVRTLTVPPGDPQ